MQQTKRSGVSTIQMVERLFVYAWRTCVLRDSGYRVVEKIRYSTSTNKQLRGKPEYPLDVSRYWRMMYCRLFQGRKQVASKSVCWVPKYAYYWDIKLIDLTVSSKIYRWPDSLTNWHANRWAKESMRAGHWSPLSDGKSDIYLTSIKPPVLVAISLSGMAACIPIRGTWNRPPRPSPAMRGNISCTALYT